MLIKEAERAGPAGERITVHNIWMSLFNQIRKDAANTDSRNSKKAATLQ
jgi:hypothetical protein